MPHLFLLHGPSIATRSGRQLGIPMFLFGMLPLPAPRLFISGVTRDSAGAILGSCTVSLFRTLDNLLMEAVVSDATTGAYSFSSVGLGEEYFVVAYKQGSPDVAGTTVRTLIYPPLGN